MIPAWAHYTEATVPGVECGTCSFYNNGLCEMFDRTPVNAGYVCDKWDDTIEKSDVTCAGIAVRAADTGRVLMIQRSSKDKKDPAAGTWEFPGGHLNDGEYPFLGARREWQEEVGHRLPRGKHKGHWRSGNYQGFIHEIPSEASVKLNLDPKNRKVLNPDDPDQDEIENAAWWEPEHMKRSRAVRQELHDQRAWSKVQKGEARAATLHLRVNGVSRHPGGHVYRMVTRDGHYIGATNPTKIRARKGDHLKIQANDLGRNPAGDFIWINPNVLSVYNDSTHSWRELEALAGGEITKDNAPGPGGNVPPAGDSANGQIQRMSAGTLAAMTPAATSEVPSDMGPTLTSVHRRRPFKNISVAYMNRNVEGEVLKGDKIKQLVYGVVLEPNSLDSQDDFMLPSQVEKAAHGYLKKVARGKASVAKLQHQAQGFFKNKQGLVPVESFIAPDDFTNDGIEMIKKGTWVMCLHCEDPQVWQDVMDGKYTGFSIGGTGVRQSFRLPPEIPVGDGVMKTAKPEDFARWRTCTWEGSN